MPVPEDQRRFALEVVRTLRGAGFQAYWAGGCVRDQLLGRVPKDYDVATSATPGEIRDLFGRRRTLAIGAAFGVITVLGPKSAGMIEVATFRQDAQYSDGRHPDHVTFSSPREDALRRDFTINGLFYDPVEEQVIDFVAGQEDLQRRRLRAIGQPRDRFAEDKLRMLRAIRFAAAFDFEMEPQTLEAIREMAPQITVVSAERIADEMRRILAGPGRVRAVRLILETGLAAAILPEIVLQDDAKQELLSFNLEVLGRLQSPCFPLALAALVMELTDVEGVRQLSLRWKLSNKETDRAAWLVGHRNALVGAPTMRWSVLQPLLISPGIHDLLALYEAATSQGAEEAAYCREKLGLPPDQLNPPLLVTGDDLLRGGIPAGPQYKELLQRIRNRQLDGQLRSKEDALEWVREQG